MTLSLIRSLDHEPGWEPDPPELNHKDPVLAATRLFGGGLPLIATTEDILPVQALDQYSIDANDMSCVSQALTQPVWAAMVRWGATPEQMDLLSRRVLHGLFRRLNGDFDRMAGGHIRQAVGECMAGIGFCPESVHPWSLPFNLAPTMDTMRLCADQRAAGGFEHARIIEPKGPARIEAMKRAIVAKMPVVFGTAVYREFRGIDGKTPYAPTPGAKKWGGHAMVLVGYDDRIGAGRVKNSFGPHWADSGYFWAKYSWLQNAGDPTIVTKCPPFTRMAA